MEAGSEEPEDVDVAAAGDAFAAGGEEGRVDESVDAGDLYILRQESAVLEEPGVGPEEVDVMAAGHRGAVSGPAE